MQTISFDGVYMVAQHSFWGWGKEDNNMVRRLQLHGMWPPNRPQVPARPKVRRRGSAGQLDASGRASCLLGSHIEMTKRPTWE